MKRVVFIIAAMLGVFVPTGARGETSTVQEGCYVKFRLQESKRADGTISFSLRAVESVFGSYEGVVRRWHPEEARRNNLVLLSSSNASLGEFILPAARVITGEPSDPRIQAQEIAAGAFTVEMTQGIVEAVVPYDARIFGAKVSGPYGESPLVIPRGSITCTRTCLVAGESGVFSQRKSCCSGFAPQSTGLTTFVCQPE